MLRSRLIPVLLVAVAACTPAFRTSNFPTPVSLFEAGMEQFRLGKWENAVLALEAVTLQLSARDTLLPRAHYFLAQAHTRQENYQLAAASFMRLFEGYPSDTLADDALLGAAQSYERSWPGPEYDPDFAQKALEAFELVQRLYPTSPLASQAQEGELRMNDGLARKELNTGMYYFRRGAYDSALLYFRYAVTDYPGTGGARDARMMMVRTYQRLRYDDEVTEHCRALRTAYPSAADVRELCGAVVADSAR